MTSFTSCRHGEYFPGGALGGALGARHPDGAECGRSAGDETRHRAGTTPLHAT